MVKALFFDIDGTLVSFKTHVIPDSTVEALRQAHARGIKIYISTGRPMQIIVNLGQISNLISGYISTNGALCLADDKIVSEQTLTDGDVRQTLDACRRWHATCLVASARHIAVINSTSTFVNVFLKGLGLENFRFEDIREMAGEPVTQLTPFITEGQEKDLAPLLQSSVSNRWHPAFTDITRTGADKGTGLLAMMAHEGLRKEETMAFGDGGNDIPIIRQAGIGVAMGNSDDTVKAAAGYVTTSVDDDGITNALKHFHVI